MSGDDRGSHDARAWFSPVGDSAVLRLLDLEDVSELTQLVRRNLTHLGRWFPWCTPAYNLDACRRWVGSAMHGYGRGEQLPLVLVEAEELLGVVCLVDIARTDEQSFGHETASAEINWWIGESAQGRGLVHQAATAVRAYAHGPAHLHRLTARIEPGNRRSEAVARRLGFRYEGTLRHVCRWGGRWRDHCLYSILVDDRPDGLPGVKAAIETTKG